MSVHALYLKTVFRIFMFKEGTETSGLMNVDRCHSFLNPNFPYDPGFTRGGVFRNKTPRGWQGSAVYQTDKLTQ
jgi:hypothetical protein